MSANTFANGTTDETITFDKPINYLNVYVAAGVTFAISLDKGENFMSMPAGFHSFKIGSVKEIQIQADGEWELIGVQA